MINSNFEKYKFFKSLDNIPIYPYLCSKRLQFFNKVNPIHESIQNANNKKYKLRSDKAKFNYIGLKHGLKTDIHDLSNDFKISYVQYCRLNNQNFKSDYEDLNFYFNEIFYDTGYYFPTLFTNFYRNQKKKMFRVEEKIKEIYKYSNDNYKAYFITLTLREHYDSNTLTKEIYQSIRSRIVRFITNYSVAYVCNKDFGLNDTKRLHFHGVILMRSSLLNSFIFHYNKKFGFCKLELINNRTDLLSRYVQKLSLHAMKVDYGYFRECLIYSRNFPYYLFS